MNACCFKNRISYDFYFFYKYVAMKKDTNQIRVFIKQDCQVVKDYDIRVPIGFIDIILNQNLVFLFDFLINIRGRNFSTFYNIQF